MGKEQPKKYVVIQIVEMNKITTVKKNEISRNGIIRVKGYMDKEDRWLTQSFEIPLINFGLTDEDDKKKLLDFFSFPNQINDPETSRIIKKIVDEYGDILAVKLKKLLFKTSRYKKKFKMKQRRI